MEKEFDGTSYGKIVYRQSKNLTMDKKICIVVCPTGALFAKAQNPTQPYTPEEIAREVIDAYREGACMAHLHNRDEKGYNLSTEEVITETMDLIFDECPDIITSPSVHMGFEPEKGSYSLESVKPMIEALLKHGRKYIQTTIFTPISYILDGFLCVATEENTQ
ncbi:MAG: hypothetical protein GTN80_11305, partial [Nitrososphaeria archaeon]|nr:hypothetical protein [Nitrososphaeria archaeon]NIQ34205.1 hypothetical protein [Nitrososphaeria archaeon]